MCKFHQDILRLSRFMYFEIKKHRNRMAYEASKTDRKITSIYTAVSGTPDIIFTSEEWTSLPPYVSQLMKCYTTETLTDVFRAMDCQMPICRSLAEWIFSFLSKAPVEYVARILGMSCNIFAVSNLHQRGFIILERIQLHRLVCASLFIHHYRKLRYAIDSRLAFDLLESRRFVIILLSGAPGTGKSTIASLLASRLSISHILSTDSVRHAMRTIYPIEQYPILHCSTYECSKFVEDEDMTIEERMFEGYRRQSQMVGDHLDQILSTFEAQRTSIIIEGVHLSVDVLMRLVQKYPKVIPFLVYIKKQDFHMQRFAVRAKCMTTDPTENKYISNIKAIRTVQSQLATQATKYAIPKIDNRNIDRTLETLHQTILSYLKVLKEKPSMYDEETQRIMLLDPIWKRRNKKITSKTKTINDIRALQANTESPSEHIATVEELLQFLPIPNTKVVDEVGGNLIKYLKNGSMKLKQIESQSAVEPVKAPHPEIEVEDNNDLETDAADLTLTDFMDTTDLPTEEPDELQRFLIMSHLQQVEIPTKRNPI